MRLPEVVTDFLGGPAMIVLGTRSPVFVPDIGRAVGLTIGSSQDEIDLMVSRWQWPQTTSNIAATGQLAATFSRPTDYVTYQLKGGAWLREAEASDLAVAERFSRRMSDCLSALGVGPAVVAQWFNWRDVVVTRLAVESIFIQTPGAKAGSAITLENVAAPTVPAGFKPWSVT